MATHNVIRTRGICSSTGKVKYASKADAKRVRERVPEFRDCRPYLCDACQFHHLGHADVLPTREDHRVRHGAEPTPEDEPLTKSVRMAAVELAVRADFLEGLITDGKMHAYTGRNGTWRVPVKEIEKWKTLMMRSA